MYRKYAFSRHFSASFVLVFFLEKFYGILDVCRCYQVRSTTTQKLHCSGLKINVKQSFRDSRYN